MSTAPAIPVAVLCGFLGSGKTTLLRRWRRDEALQQAACIVHDLSEFGMDAELVGGSDAPPEAGRLQGRVAALHGSHARELLHQSVGRALEEIAVLRPEPTCLLVESTGAARPWPLLQALHQDSRYQLRHFIVTVDSLNLLRDFASGAALLSGQYADAATALAGSLLVEQVAFASLIILTKTDLVPREAVDVMERALRKINSRAAVGRSAQAGLGWAQLDAVLPPNSTALRELAASLGVDTPSTATPSEVDCLIFRETKVSQISSTSSRAAKVCENVGL
jgi:G3E family GTPase